MPICLNLNRSPLCHTLSKALLISQNTTLISLPSSTAFEKVWHKSANWKTAESPGVKPDCTGVNLLLKTR